MTHLASSNMTIEELGQKTKAKYPQYKDIADGDLGQKILKKYPQYQSQIGGGKPDSGAKNPQGTMSFMGQTQKPDGFFTSILKGIVKPFVQAGVTGLSAVEGAGRLAIGDQAGAEKALEGYNVPGFGKVAPNKIGTDIEEQQKTGAGPFGRETVKTIGTGAEIAATLAPGAGAAGAAEKTLGTVVKEGALHAGAVGSVAGAGAAAQGENATGWDILTGGALGGIGGAALGAAVPLVAAGVEKTGQVLAGKSRVGESLINSLIKPLKKDFSYGKNPGRGVSAEGITGNSLEELGTKISERRQEIGKELVEKARTASDKVLDISDAITPINEAIAKASQAPETNASLITRLKGAKNDLLGMTEKEVQEAIPNTALVPGQPQMRTVKTTVPSTQLSGINPEQAVGFKQRIGDITKFTGNASDDSIVNSALKKAYGKVKGAVEIAVPGIKDLNERYADLTSAEIATKYRDIIEARQPILKMGGKVLGASGAILGALASGGAALPAAIAGVSGIAIDKALEHPAVLTRLAAWLSRATPDEATAVFQANPYFRNALLRAFNVEPSEGKKQEKDK